MEPTEVIIARLVLGYLKGEKCRSAYKEFLKTSSHLQDTCWFKSKYLPTRFVGLTLEDILSEYFEMYKIVQGRLEATNYYNERHAKNSLVDQLLYLFNKVQSSRASTPCPRSPQDSNLGETSPSHGDQVSDVETTPAHMLPGNVRCTSEDSYLHKTPRRKMPSKFGKSHTVAAVPATNREDMSEVLAQTLLDNTEFHEKIAQTINKVAEKQYRRSSELDRTIKTVVRETEEDPMFDKILDEIIESTVAVDTKGIETSSTSSSVARNINENFDSRSKRRRRLESVENEDQHDGLYSDSKTVEEQNDEAIRSIVANSRLTSDTPARKPEAQANNEVIVFDGSLDKYLISNTCNANTQTQPVQNPLYIDATGGLLMVPSNLTTNVVGNLQIDTSKQFYFLNKQQTIGWNMPTIKTPNIITEQDILAMPTVIVNDEKQNKSTTESVLQTPVLTSEKSSALQMLRPKPIIEISADYVTVCSGQEQQQQSGLKKVIYPKSSKAQNDSEAAVNTDTTDASTNQIATTEVPTGAKSLPGDLLDEDPQEPQIADDTNFETREEIEPQLIKDEPPQAKTPPQPEPQQKATPKSGSHVRNLDFSTPPKITSTNKKGTKATPGSKTPPFVHKKQAAKTLFKSREKDLSDEDKESCKTVEDKNKVKKKSRLSSGTWDSDLRAIVVQAEDVKAQTPKRKRKTPVKKAKKTKKKASKEVEQQLNTTEHEAALLEAALQTPIKNEKEDLQTADGGEGDKTNETAFAPYGDQKKLNSSVKTDPEKKVVINSKKVGDVAEDNPNKMILSPSKLNANKRNLVNTSQDKDEDVNPGDEKAKFITPEMVKENKHHPIRANRNIMPMLNTPLKDDVPKTPGLQTPLNQIDPNLSIMSGVFTPFSKMLEENLKGVDLNSFPTPNIPITPSFPPFTPSADLASPYSNRATDYSTSSSYYQPSDSEQNRSLEANVMELEKKQVKILSDVVVVMEDIAASSPNKTSKSGQNVSPHSSTVNEHLNIFNKNIIGKKNLNLMQRASGPSSSEDTTSESSSEEEEEDSCSVWDEKESNDTVIHRGKSTETPKRTYSLRNRTTTVNDTKTEPNKKPVEPKNTRTSKKSTAKETNDNSKQLAKANSKQTDKSKKVNSMEEVEAKKVVKEEVVDTKSTEISAFQTKVLKELEEKRLRMIDKFRAGEKPSAKKPPPKLPAKRQTARFVKIKPIPNITCTRRKGKKPESPKKPVQAKTRTKNNKTVSTSKDRLNGGENTDDGISTRLNLSEDEAEEPEVTCKVKSSIISAEKADKSSSDVEAQNLIDGLKERGIHLMHNKPSPNKKVNDASNEPEAPNNDIKATENLDSTNDLDSVKDTSETTTETKSDEVSTTQFISELRETYDTQLFQEESIHIIFDESKIVTKTPKDYQTFLSKKFIGKIFVEEINNEIDVPITFSPLDILLDIPPASAAKVQATDAEKSEAKVKQLEKTHNRKESVGKADINKDELNLIKDVSNPAACDEITKSDDDLMNYAIIAGVREATPEGSDSPKSTRKRKIRSDENSHTEKKCKTLLKKINVESFLNNIHGGA